MALFLYLLHPRAESETSISVTRITEQNNVNLNSVNT